MSQHEVHLPEISDLFSKVGMTWLETVELVQPDGVLLHEDCALLLFLKVRVNATEKLIQELAKNDRQCPG